MPRLAFRRSGLGVLEIAPTRPGKRRPRPSPPTSPLPSTPALRAPEQSPRQPEARDHLAAAAEQPTRSRHADASGTTFGILAAVVAAVAIAVAQWTDITSAGRVLLPLVGLLTAAAFVPMLARRHPDEPWLPSLLVWGVAFKIGAILARYFTFGGEGDAGVYHEYGLEFVNGVAEPLDAVRRTGFVMFVTGHVYNFVGADQITGFFAFGLFAFIGSYLWYRATANAVPFLDRRMYAAFVFFLPSIAFWPASIGKEALMQVGIGSAALGTAYMLRQHLWRGLLVAAPGVYLLWAVRPHLFALVMLSAAVAYVIGRRMPRLRGRAKAQGATLSRPLGAVIVAFLSVFGISQAMNFLGMENLSIDAIEEELNEQADRTAQGGSTFKEGEPKSLTPLSLPQGAVTVLLRPFVWEVEKATQLIASIEAAAITYFLFRRRHSLSLSLSRARAVPFLLYCWTLTGLYAIAFSSFSNMGLLVRQRTLVLPAFLVLLCLDRALAERADERSDERADVGARAAR